MDRQGMNRRDFGKLAAAAFGGIVAGSMLNSSAFAAGKADPSLLLEEPHTCRGLNTCKGKGACKTASSSCKGENACAGQGGCATAEKHSCAGNNACKGQGGCHSNPGQNSCKGEGGCGVPYKHKGGWKKARAALEKAYKAKTGKELGPAPKEA